jgi:hypothetical protein
MKKWKGKILQPEREEVVKKSEWGGIGKRKEVGSGFIRFK